ncbi:MAG TPA: hypothetical protein VD963_03490, partial [Phycisphaerales bacterium]|nr:hypothetical protein [Phycisphaerales bacterium]
SAGGLAVDRIARWDGAQWHPFGGGFTNFGFFPPLQDLRVYRGQLFCAGSFRAINHQPGVEPAAGIARWDGAAWHALVEPPAQVSAPAFFSLAEHQGELVLGGNVVMIAGAPAYAWVRWTSGAPFIARHPVPLDAFESAAAEFSVAVTATGSVVPAYQWRRDGLALTDGPTPHGSILSGATSPTLVVANLAGDDAGEYDVVVTSPCGEATSAPAALAVRPAFCASDFDADGVIGTGDVSAFLAQWFADVAVGGLAADFDGSGAVATPDISAFLAAWFVALAGGC